MDDARPRVVVAMVGTATEVGKTWVACRLVSALVAGGRRVSARKPAQSYLPDDPTTDADELAAATGEDPFVVCPRHRRYEVPMAPPMAAEALGSPGFTVATLAHEVTTSWVGPAVDVGIVELAGGTRSPMADDGDGVDLTLALGPDVTVVVADAGLGTINAVRSTCDGLSAAGPVLVHLNRFDPTVDLHRRNREWLAVRDGLSVTTGIDELAVKILEQDVGSATPGSATK